MYIWPVYDSFDERNLFTINFSFSKTVALCSKYSKYQFAIYFVLIVTIKDAIN